jgi:NAD(P)-dependent dehydrogenase (short-subunit alcohol dehydrogenase family)
VTIIDHKESSMSIALVTGASRGLGLEIARALTGRGWSVIADARDAQA